jgi:NmrA-like family
LDAVAKAASLERFVWSGLSSVKKWSKGKYTWVFYFDAKADATQYIKGTHSKLWKITSVIQIGAYLSNHLNMPGFIPKKAADGLFEVMLPPGMEVKFPHIATEFDTSRFVRALFLEVAAGKNLLAYREQLSFKDFMSIWSTTNNVPWRSIEAPMPDLANTGPDAREFAATGACIAEFGYEGREDPTVV